MIEPLYGHIISMEALMRFEEFSFGAIRIDGATYGA